MLIQAAGDSLLDELGLGLWFLLFLSLYQGLLAFGVAVDERPR